ncbi:MAG TPA: DUF3667 domain-containing protein [Lysobacter sp.]
MSGHDLNSAPANCENCATPLQGHYCHACGQSLHSPTRHFGHAVEEVFESFWHLDGRVFRTLRDLMVPGRVACNYLAGQRVRYIAPLRLFVILSLLTFFVGKLVVHVDQAPIQFSDQGSVEIGKARTVAEVRAVEARLLKDLSVAEKEAAKVPGVNPALVAARAQIQGEAAARIVELEEVAKDRSESTSRTTTTTEPKETGSPTDPDASSSTPKKHGPTSADDDEQWRFNGRPWDEKTNPVDVSFLPGFVDRWLNRKIGRAKVNMEDISRNPDHFVQAFLGAVPTALFLLMPFFALLLKVAYLGSGRRYLEHLVVALYSHAWLLLALLAMFVLNAVKDGFTASWVALATSLIQIGLWIWIPIYLLVMQHRVYRGHWALTGLRYLVIGWIYLILVGTAVGLAVLAGIAS